MHAPCRLPQIHLIGPSMRSPGGTVPRRREVAAVDVEGEDPGTQADSESRAVVGAFAAAPGERPGQEGVDRGADGDGVDRRSSREVPQPDRAVVATGNEQG